MTYLFLSKYEYMFCVVSILFCYLLLQGAPSVLIMVEADYMLHCFLPPSFFDLLVMEFSNLY
jgi:hypothetical protein